MSSVIEFVNVRKEYAFEKGGVAAVHDLSFSLGAGEVAVLRCETRLARIVVVNLLSALEAPTAGSCFFASRDMAQMSERAAAELQYTEIGVVHKNPLLLDGMTLFDNVLLPLNFSGGDSRGAAARAEDALDAFGLLAKKHYTPEWLTYRERLAGALARELCKRPRLLILDATMDDVSQETEDLMADAVRRFSKAGCAVILTTEGTPPLPEARTIPVV